MSSSITCCSVLEEQVPGVHFAEFQSNFESYGSSTHGFQSDTVVGRATGARRKREFTPDEQKDDTYWLKRSRNNESAKRSRLRRRMEECLLEARAVELLRENETLRAALSAIHYHNNTGVKSLDGVMGHPVGQGLSRDTYLTPLSDFPGADHVSPYALASRGQMQLVGPGYGSVCFSGLNANVMTPNVPDNLHQRDRHDCVLGIPPFRDGNSFSNTCIPVTYNMCPREVQSHRSPELRYRHSAHFSLMTNNSGLAEPGCAAAHIQVHEANGAGITEDVNKMKAIKEQEGPSVLPLLPHKLRYKVNKAW